MDRLKIFFDSCASGDLISVKKILDSYSDVDRANVNNVTALQVASANGHDSIVKYLIMRGASLDKANNKKWTPLLHASRHGHSNVIKTLIQNQADVNAKTRLGVSAMLLASKKGDLETCKLLQNMGIDLASSANSGPYDPDCDITPIMAACFYGHEQLVKFYIKIGQDFNQRSLSLGLSCLMLAALGGHENIVKLLVENGVNPNQTDINNRTALDFAVSRNHKQIQMYLNKITNISSNSVNEDLKNDIIEAIKKGNLKQVREILDNDISQRDATQSEDGATALMLATILGRLDIVQELVERGCDVNKQDHLSGWTALMQSVYHNKKNIAKYLINSGSDVHIRTKHGYNALDMVVLLENLDTDLYRLLAAATIGSSDVVEGSKNDLTASRAASFSRHFTLNGNTSSKSQLKHWWGKMSDKFKHLKIGNTMGNDRNFNTNEDNIFENVNVNSGSDNNEIFKIYDNENDVSENNLANKKKSTSFISLRNTFVPIKKLKLKEVPNVNNTLKVISYNKDDMSIKSNHNATLATNGLISIRKQSSMPTSSTINKYNTLNIIKTAESPMSSSSNEEEFNSIKNPLFINKYSIDLQLQNSNSSSMKPNVPFFLPPPNFNADSHFKMPQPRNSNSRSSSVMGDNDSNCDRKVTSNEINVDNNKSAHQVFVDGKIKNLNELRVGKCFVFNERSKDRVHDKKSTEYSISSKVENSSKHKKTVKIVTSNASMTTPKSSSSSSSSSSSPKDVSPSTSSETDELRMGLMMTSHTRNKPTRNLERSKVHSSASSSTGTLTAGSDKFSDLDNAGRQYSESSTLVDYDVTMPSSPFQPPITITCVADDVGDLVHQPSIDHSNNFNYNAPSQQYIQINNTDNLNFVLKKYSLEKYQSVLEEQEVDMEAFLVLTESNLKELGINNEESRYKLLSAINDINKSKQSTC